MTPRVSVLMTCYERQDYLPAAIESVLAQSCGDFELIIVDDASGDGSLAIAHDYAARDERIRVIANERNLGDYPNRNHAATFVRAPYFKYHDSDDLMYPHCLATLLEPLATEPDAGFALTAARAWEGGPAPMLLSPRMAYQREFLGPGLFHLGPACALFRTAVFRRLGGWPLLGVHSDYVFWLQACARVPVLLVPADLFWYRVHPGQELQQRRSVDEATLPYSRAWTALAGNDCPLSDRECEIAKSNLASIIARVAWRNLRQGRLELAGKLATGSGLGLRSWIRYLRRPRRDRLAGTPLASDGEYRIAPPAPRKVSELASHESGR